jgi:Ca2+-binding EF-hand superfamily protein
MSLPSHSRDLDDGLRNFKTTFTNPVDKCILFLLTLVSKLEMDYLVEQFKNMDVNKDKNLSQEEFNRAFAIIPGQNVSVVKFLFECIDTSENGVISFKEFVDTMAVLLKGNDLERALFSFTLFDRSKKGFVDKMDFSVVISGIYKSLSQLNLPEFDTEHLKLFVDLIMDSFDLSKTGKIGFEDFHKAIVTHGYILHGLGVLEATPEKHVVVNSGKLVTFGSKTWQSAFEMMLGIRLSYDLVKELKRPIRDRDFTITIKFQLPQEKETWFVDMAPHAFEIIRKVFRVSRRDWLLSLGPEQFFGNLLLGNMSTLSEKVSDGKSASFFFYSHDGKFMVKTIGKKEERIFSEILPDYFKHVKNNPKTLLVRIYAHHMIDEIPFVVMGNCFDSPIAISTIYDLKGSTVGRTNPNGFVKKDLDLKTKFKIGTSKKQEIMDIIKSDVEFLKTRNLIDYSLIVGVVDNTGKKLPDCYKDLSIYKHSIVVPQVEENGIVDTIFFLGIIDLFTFYDSYKHTEHILKSVVKNSKEISAVPAKDYADRFVKFMETIFE